HAVVARERHIHAPSDAETRSGDDRDLAHGADGEDRTLGRVDDRGELRHVVHAQVRDRERGAGVLLGPQLSRSRPLSQVPRGARPGSVAASFVADKCGPGALESVICWAIAASMGVRPTTSSSGPATSGRTGRSTGAGAAAAAAGATTVPAFVATSTSRRMIR